MEQLTGTLSGVPNSNNYEKLNYKPQINGVELVGNKTSEELGLGGDYVTRQELKEGLEKKMDDMEKRLDGLVDGNEVEF